MFAKKSLLLLIFLVIGIFVLSHQESLNSCGVGDCDELNPDMGFEENECDGHFVECHHEDIDESAVFEDSSPISDGDDQCYDNESHNECENYCKDFPFTPDQEIQVDCYTRSELAEIVFDTMPNIPDCLINFITQSDAGFLDYIITNHANFEGLVTNMDSCTVERFCKDVPSFGMKLGELSEEVLNNILFTHPGLEKCIISTTTTISTTTSIVTTPDLIIPEPTTPELTTSELTTSEPTTTEIVTTEGM